MPSPFPGMDPYLEDPSEWGGVHHALIVAIAAQLNLRLPAGFRAKIEQYIRVEESEGDSEPERRLRNPDVFIPDTPSPYRNGSSTALLSSPTLEMVLLPGELTRHRRVLIETLDGRNVLTALELLSPSNKKIGPDRSAYLNKRNEYLAAGTNLVEVDLLRSGLRLPVGNPAPPVADYYILVSAAERRPMTSVWAFSVRQSIPNFAVPLLPQIGSVVLELRSCLDRVYDEGRYGQAVDYTAPPAFAMKDSDAAWATELLSKRGA